MSNFARISIDPEIYSANGRLQESGSLVANQEAWNRGRMAASRIPWRPAILGWSERARSSAIALLLAIDVELLEEEIQRQDPSALFY